MLLQCYNYSDINLIYFDDSFPKSAVNFLNSIIFELLFLLQPFCFHLIGNCQFPVIAGSLFSVDMYYKLLELISKRIIS